MERTKRALLTFLSVGLLALPAAESRYTNMNYIVASPAEDADVKTDVVTVDYTDGRLSIRPSVLHNRVGDIVEYRTSSGEVLVRALNKYNDDGIDVRSYGGAVRFTQRNAGVFGVALQLARPDGEIVGWKPRPTVDADRAPDHVITIDYRNGTFATSPNHTSTKLGEVIEYRSAGGEDLVLNMAGPFDDAGTVQLQAHGSIKLLEVNAGSYPIRCSLVTADKGVTGWLGGYHDPTNGNHDDTDGRTDTPPTDPFFPSAR